ncbi:hypothetical protein JG688_00009190, partial [Phytophthora aleatoria]
DKAKKWISELDITVDVPPPYRIELEAIPILAEKMHVVDFACRYQLGDTALMEAMSKLFGPRPDVIIVDPPIWGVVERGMPTVPDEKIERLFTGVGDHKVLIPVNCSGTH